MRTGPLGHIAAVTRPNYQCETSSFYDKGTYLHRMTLLESSQCQNDCIGLVHRDAIYTAEVNRAELKHE